MTNLAAAIIIVSKQLAEKITAMLWMTQDKGLAVHSFYFFQYTIDREGKALLVGFGYFGAEVQLSI